MAGRGSHAGPAMTTRRDNETPLVQDVGGDETDRGQAKNRQRRAVDQDMRKRVVRIKP